MSKVYPPKKLNIPQRITLKSYAKVNLFLAVLDKRSDGYHNISTIFERISLFDLITIKTRSDHKINIICSDPGVPQGKANICFKSAKLLKEESKLSRGADIFIKKNIPVGAGLGGGSSNAASVLTGLNKLWKIGFGLSKLVSLSKTIGCDVPFFLYDIQFAKGEARGDIIKPLKTLKKIKLWHVLVVPKINVSTPLVYRKWDEYSRLTMPECDARIINLRLFKNEYFLRGQFLRNDLEEVTIRLYPEVAHIKKKLSDSGAKAILMSGSGPAVFGLFGSRKEALSVTRRLHEQKKLWRVFLVSTC